MATVLHLLTGGDPALALPVIVRQVEAGDAVTVALVQGAPAPGLPRGVTVRVVPDDLSYHQLLDVIFAADQVVTW